MSSTNSVDPLEVLIVTVDEYYYVPRFLKSLVASDDIEVVGIATVPPSLGTQSTLSFAWELYRSFGPLVFAKHLLFYGKYATLDATGRIVGSDSVYSPERLARRHGIEYRHVRDVNDDAFVSYAESVTPDVLASVAATQKFGDRLLSVPDGRAVNVHSSLLPKYRGVSPSFWTLLHDEDETGVTVHEMAEELDSGLIVHQERVPIRPDDTLHSLNTRLAERGSDALLTALERIRSGDVDGERIDPEEGSYFSVPSRQEVQEFRQRGNHFF